MKKTERKVKVDLSITVPTITSNDGTDVFQLSDEEVIEAAKFGISTIATNLTSKERECKKLDEEYAFSLCNINLDGLIYDESNPDTYKNFVYHYLKEYYVDSRHSNHSQNGGHWSHDRYETKLNLHTLMLNSEDEIYTVKDYLIEHLTSANTARMYGAPQRSRRVRKLKDTDDAKQFWSFVFDHKILDINGTIQYSDNVTDKLNRIYTTSEVVILKLMRDGMMDLLPWFVEKYGLNLYKSEKLHRNRIKASSEILLSFVCLLLERCHDRRIHDTYNNGVCCRLKNFDGTKLTSDTWMTNHCNRIAYLIGFIHNNFPKLEVIDNSLDTETSGVYSNLLEWIQDKMLGSCFESEYKGKTESAKDLLKRIKKQIKTQSS